MIAPMLASAMTDPVTGGAFDARFASGWALEQKMDGHRVLVDVSGGRVQAYSRPRAGAQFPHVKSLPPTMVDVLLTLPDGIYDGELCAAGGISSDVTRKGATLVVVLFDRLAASDGTRMIPLTGRGYADRRIALLAALACLPDGQQCVSTVESLTPTWARVQAVWARGGEGVILKRLTSVYQAGRRSPDWLKVKAGGVAVGEIIGFETGALGPYSVTVVRLASGLRTTVKTLDNATIADITANPDRYLGARLVISHKGVLASGKYRHPMFDHLAGDGE